MSNRDKYPNRITLTLSVDEATKERFKKVAKANHLTVSGMLTSWVWAQPLPEDDDTEEKDDE